MKKDKKEYFVTIYRDDKMNKHLVCLNVTDGYHKEVQKWSYKLGRWIVFKV